MFGFKKNKISLMPGLCLPSPLDKRDVLTSEIDPEIKRYPEICPPPFDLSVLKQEGPSCVGFSSAALKQEKEMREKIVRIFDGLWIYQECKKIDGYNGAGTYLRIAMQVLQKTGAKPLNENGPEKYKIGGYAKVDDLNFEGLKKAIFVHGAIIAGFYGSNQGWKSAYIRPPKSGENIWGHAVLLTSYQKNYIEGLNSWGDWGDQGKFYVPSDYLPFEVWAVLTDLPTSFLFPTIFEGWVAVDYLRGFPYGFKTGQIARTVYGLKVRQKPTTKSLALFSLKQGQEVEIMSDEITRSDNYLWQKIKVKKLDN